MLSPLERVQGGGLDCQISLYWKLLNTDDL